MAPGIVLGWVLCAWVSAAAALIAYRMVVGRIPLRGLLTIDGDRFSAERLQLLLVFMGALVVYAADALNTKKMPEISDELLIILGGSNALYIAGKVARPPQKQT